MSGVAPDAVEPPGGVPTSSGGSMARGATLMVGMRAVSRCIGIFSTAILARLLTPGDFGLVVLGTSVLNIAQLLSDFSLSAALIRMRDPTAAQFNTAWTISLLRGLVVAFVVVVSAPLVARSMHEPRVIAILWTMAAATIIQSFENIRLVDLQLQMRFGLVFRYQFVTRIVSFGSTLVLALVLRNYWALVLSSLLTALITVAYSYVLRPSRPRLTLSAWRDLFAFSKWAMAGSILVVVDVYSINFIMGWIGGARALGMYQVSAQIAALPASEVAAPIRTPMYAGFAKLMHEPKELARAFVDGFSFLFMVITPMSVGIYAVAPLITPLALGPQWTDATRMIRAVVFYALFDAFGHYPHNLFILTNRQPRLIALTIVFLAIRVPAAIYGGWADGAVGAVYGMAATAVFGALFWFAASLPMVRVSAAAVLGGVWRTTAGCAVMLSGILVLFRSWPMRDGAAAIGLKLLACIVCGATLHVGTQLALWRLCGSPWGAESRALGIVRGLLRRLRPRTTRPLLG